MEIRLFYYTKLAVVKLTVESAKLKELLVSSSLDNISVLHNEDEIGVLYG